MDASDVSRPRTTWDLLVEEVRSDGCIVWPVEEFKAALRSVGLVGPGRFPHKKVEKRLEADKVAVLSHKLKDLGGEPYGPVLLYDKLRPEADLAMVCRALDTFAKLYGDLDDVLMIAKAVRAGKGLSRSDWPDAERLNEAVKHFSELVSKFSGRRRTVPRKRYRRKGSARRGD